MSIGTFGTFNLVAKPKKYKKPSKQDKDGRFKCAGCNVANNDEEILISHVLTVNECKATYYKDRG